MTSARRRGRGHGRRSRRRARHRFVRTTSIVASAGFSIPAPLAIPRFVQPSWETATCFATVSVVRIACAASSPRIRARPPRRPPPRGAAACRAVRRSGRSSTRGRPQRPRRGRRRRVRPWRGCRRNPRDRVHALAPPELRTTARARPSPTAVRLQVTGAASTRFVVNTPAATSRGPSFTTRARSGRPEAFNPAVTPAAAEPAGTGDAHGATPIASRAAVLREAEGDVHGLDGGPAVPLPRLSIAHMAINLPAWASTPTWTTAPLDPATIAVVGHCPSGRRSM